MLAFCLEILAHHPPIQTVEPIVFRLNSTQWEKTFKRGLTTPIHHYIDKAVKGDSKAGQVKAAP
jgi:hypothetical protein